MQQPIKLIKPKLLQKEPDETTLTETAQEFYRLNSITDSTLNQNTPMTNKIKEISPKHSHFKGTNAKVINLQQFKQQNNQNDGKISKNDTGRNMEKSNTKRSLTPLQFKKIMIGEYFQNNNANNSQQQANILFQNNNFDSGTARNNKVQSKEMLNNSVTIRAQQKSGLDLYNKSFQDDMQYNNNYISNELMPFVIQNRENKSISFKIIIKFIFSIQLQDNLFNIQ